MRQLPFLFAAVGLLAGCPDREVSALIPDPAKVEFKSIPVTINRNLDLLFVIDNSGSMGEEQASLRANFPQFIGKLRTIEGGLPDVQIGVVTSDMGTNGGPTTSAGGCMASGSRGHNGDLRKLDPPDAMGTSPIYYLRNVQDPAMPGNPNARLTNYDASRITLEAAFGKIADVRSDGCGFEMHLASMRRAIDPTHPINGVSGFIRDNAYLGVVIIADEDDCSVRAADSNAFFGQGDLGNVVSYACFRSSTVCDGNLGDQEGPRTNCRTNNDSRYHERIADFVNALKARKSDPSLLIVSGIIGNTTPVTVGRRTLENGPTVPALGASCRYSGGGNNNQNAYPGIRLATFLNSFPQTTTTTICSGDLADGMQQIAKLLTSVIGSPCMEADLETNPLQCTVSDVVNPGKPNESETRIPRCDSTKSVIPCWDMTVDAMKCAGTKTQLKLDIFRGGATPPLNTYVHANCVTK